MNRVTFLAWAMLFGGVLFALPATANDRSACLSNAGSRDARIAACTRFINAGRASPSEHSTVRVRRGDLFQEQGDTHRAAVDYREALRLDPKNAAAAARLSNPPTAAAPPPVPGPAASPSVSAPALSLASGDDGRRCATGGDVEACTRVIQSGRLSNADLAIAYANRSRAFARQGDGYRAEVDARESVRLASAPAAAPIGRPAAQPAVPVAPVPLTASLADDLARCTREAVLEACTRVIVSGRLSNSDLSAAYAQRSQIFRRQGDSYRADVDSRESVRLASALPSPPAPATQVVALPPPAPAPLSLPALPVSPPPLAAVPPTQVAPAAVPAVRPGDPGRRIALVIGNSAYRSAAVLQNPGRDAGLVAAALRRVGFEAVTLEIDLAKEKLVDTLRAFAGQAENADWAVVYFAGHGIEMNGTNYLIPVDARLAVDRDIGFEAVPLDQVLNAVDGARKLRLVLLDACRDNPFARQEFFDLVRDDVMSLTKRRQQPFTYGSLPGREDFFFKQN